MDADGRPKVYPVAILDTRMVKVRQRLEKEVLVQWSNLLPEDATWERAHTLQVQFPEFAVA